VPPGDDPAEERLAGLIEEERAALTEVDPIVRTITVTG
jgi:hypothetical protein